jgi:hypothetical protein
MMRKRTRVDQGLLAEFDKRMHVFDEQFFNVEAKIDTLKKVIT